LHRSFSFTDETTVVFENRSHPYPKRRHVSKPQHVAEYRSLSNHKFSCFSFAIVPTQHCITVLRPSSMRAWISTHRSCRSGLNFRCGAQRNKCFDLSRSPETNVELGTALYLAGVRYSVLELRAKGNGAGTRAPACGGGERSILIGLARCIGLRLRRYDKRRNRNAKRTCKPCPSTSIRSRVGLHASPGRSSRPGLVFFFFFDASSPSSDKYTLKLWLSGVFHSLLSFLSPSCR
jgi:hypothetical protein